MDKNEMEFLIGEVNRPKTDLMLIADKLYEVGAIRKAKSLETIIEKLEKWQHTR